MRAYTLAHCKNKCLYCIVIMYNMYMYMANYRGARVFLSRLLQLQTYCIMQLLSGISAGKTKGRLVTQTKLNCTEMGNKATYFSHEYCTRKRLPSRAARRSASVGNVEIIVVDLSETLIPRYATVLSRRAAKMAPDSRYEKRSLCCPTGVYNK